MLIQKTMSQAQSCCCQRKMPLSAKYAVSLAGKRSHFLVTSTVYEKQTGKGQDRGLSQSLNGEREGKFYECAVAYYLASWSIVLLEEMEWYRG